MKKNSNISLIIPFNGEMNSLQEILGGIDSWSLRPSEIIIVNTEHKLNKTLESEARKLICSKDIVINLIDAPRAFPGRARNLGIKNSTNNLIAFLDSKTFPSKTWLEGCYKKMDETSKSIIWGLTVYETHSYLEKAIQYSTYGLNPLRTLPGSLIKKDIFYKVGLFLESVRAGEDGDWISRVNLHEIKTDDGKENLSYRSLIGTGLFLILKKWFRNYYFSARLLHLKTQKDIYFYFISILLILIAYNWNNLSYNPSISGWDLQSSFYIPNITTISLVIMLGCYFILRCLLFPILKGVDIIEVIFKLPAIILISLFLDIIKTAAFFTGKFHNFLNRF
jgi:glycosyltransferase involved in cell wall biosynthesis